MLRSLDDVAQNLPVLLGQKLLASKEQLADDLLGRIGN